MQKFWQIFLVRGESETHPTAEHTKLKKHAATVARENHFDKRVINYRLRIDRWT